MGLAIPAIWWIKEGLVKEVILVMPILGGGYSGRGSFWLRNMKIFWWGPFWLKSFLVEVLFGKSNFWVKYFYF